MARFLSTVFVRFLLAGLTRSLLFAALLLALPSVARAEPGVTLGLGGIVMHEPLRAGGQYQLPALPVGNPGASGGTYEVAILAMEGQGELRPDPAWFALRPQRFQLAPGERQDVAVTLNLPLLLEPGSYFALLRVAPAVEAQGAQLGVAVAAKLSFTVEHGNILSAALYGLVDALQQRAPWSYVILTALIIVIGFPLLARVFGIGISLQRRG